MAMPAYRAKQVFISAKHNACMTASMSKLQFRYFDPMSNAKITAIVIAVIAFIQGLLELVLPVMPQRDSAAIFGGTDIILVPLFSIIFVFIFTYVLIRVYNYMASKIGGIELTINSKSPKRSQRIELKKFGVAQLVKVFALVAAILGILLGLISFLFGLLGGMVAFGGLIMLPIIFVVIAAIVVAIQGVVYNIITDFTDGITYKTKTAADKMIEITSVLEMPIAKLSAIFSTLFAILGVAFMSAMPGVMPIIMATMPLFSGMPPGIAIIALLVYNLVYSFVFGYLLAWLYNQIAQRIGGGKYRS